jgi:hypothetical protein
LPSSFLFWRLFAVVGDIQSCCCAAARTHTHSTRRGDTTHTTPPPFPCVCICWHSYPSSLDTHTSLISSVVCVVHCTCTGLVVSKQKKK